MKKNVSKVALLFREFKRKCIKLYDEFNYNEPMIKSEAVESTLYLLDRDFRSDEQNEIILNLIQRLHRPAAASLPLCAGARRLHAKREADVIRMENELKELKAQTNILKVKLVMNN